MKANGVNNVHCRLTCLVATPPAGPHPHLAGSTPTDWFSVAYR